MIIHRDFESDCKRIAKVIQKQANDATSDVTLWGKADVWVSNPFIKWFNAEIRGDKKMLKKFCAEINRHLKACSVQWSDIMTNGNWYLIFEVESDDVDPEFEDW